MTPFDPNLPPNAEQPSDPNADPLSPNTFSSNPHSANQEPIDQDDLIAFHLHDLPRRQVRALHRALRHNPALQAESIAIASTLRAFPKHEPTLPLDAAALDRHWQTLLPNLTPHTPAPILPRTFFPPTTLSRPIFPRWILPTLAGSALFATALFIALHLTHTTPPPTVATTSTPSSTATPTPQPTTLEPQPPTPTQSNPSTTLFLTPHHAQPSTPTLIETATATTPTATFLTQSTPPPPTRSTTTTIATSTQTAAPSPLAPTQTPAPTQPSTPPAIHPGRSIRASTPHRLSTTELTLAMFGNITAARSASYTSVFGTSQVTQAATPAVGALASFRQQFRPWLGYRLTTTYFSPSFEYFNGLDIRQQIYEVSATYVAQGPHHRRLTTSAEAGASLLNFRYHDDYISPTPPTTYSAYRAAAVVGVGAEYAISKHWGLRAEYRALIYRPPYVANPGDTAITPTTDLTFSSNPILGITYRFGANGAD